MTALRSGTGRGSRPSGTGLVSRRSGTGRASRRAGSVEFPCAVCGRPVTRTTGEKPRKILCPKCGYRDSCCF